MSLFAWVMVLGVGIVMTLAGCVARLDWRARRRRTDEPHCALCLQPGHFCARIPGVELTRYCPRCALAIAEVQVLAARKKSS